jgi:hypothetical protein
VKEAESNPTSTSEDQERWLCSHLVQLFLDDEPKAGETVLLEDISAEGAGLAVESPYPKGLRLTIGAGEFEARVVVAECQRRETDFRLETRFRDGFRWTPSVWKPDHLFRPPIPPLKAKGATGSR